jgi:hypothetical protein
MRAASILMLCILVSGCGPDAVGDELAVETDDEAGDTDGESDSAELDSDGDGLTDEHEAELGTDPFDVDTDDDTYWDGWELAEGTDPLDPDSRIYTGWWPYHPDKDSLPQASWDTASQAEGAPFPRDTYLDQYGDLVDLHDFADFAGRGNEQPAILLIDVSAPWCSSCQIFAEWLDGTNTEYDMFWPTVRDKLEDGRFWWITVFVEGIDQGMPPTLADAQVWDDIHHHPRVPVLVDAEQHVLEHFDGGQYPHFFLLDTAMQIEFFTAQVSASDYYPAITMIDKYL